MRLSHANPGFEAGSRPRSKDLPLKTWYRGLVTIQSLLGFNQPLSPD